jgi:hypothetical protein
MAASYQLSQRLFNPLDAFHHVHEFAALEEVADDIVGSLLSLPNPPHKISQSSPQRCLASVEWTIWPQRR